MKRTASVLFAVGAVAVACSSSLSQPFQGLKNQPETIYRLQDYEPPQPTAGTLPPGTPTIPPQIQQWLTAGAAMLPPGLLPPGLLPGTAATPAGNAPRFYDFRILGSMSPTDQGLRDEIVEFFGKESNFQVPKQSCMFAEFGFQI